MAQNVTIAGATFNDVPSIETPVSGGGVARFVDTSDADATASDIALGKTAYVNGALLVGTAEQGVVPYKAGDSVTFGTASYTQLAGGFRNNYNLMFTIPLDRPVASGVTASASGSIVLYGVTAGSNQYKSVNLGASGITLTTSLSPAGVTVRASWSSAPSDFTFVPNAPVGIQAYGLTIAFS